MCRTKLPPPLQKDHRFPGQKAGKAIAVGKVGEHKEAIGCDPLQGVDLVAPEPAAELQLMVSAYPAQGAGQVEGVLIGIPWSRDRVADRGVPAHLDERRPGSGPKRGLILKAQAGRRFVVDVLIEQKLVSQVGKTRNADHRRRKDMGLLDDKILGTVILADREAGN